MHLAAKRAREINGYYAHLGEGLTQYVPPLMAVDSDKALSIALEEIAAEKIVAVEPSEGDHADPLSLIDMGGEESAGALSLIVGEGGSDADDDTSGTGDSEPA